MIRPTGPDHLTTRPHPIPPHAAPHALCLRAARRPRLVLATPNPPQTRAGGAPHPHRPLGLDHGERTSPNETVPDNLLLTAAPPNSEQEVHRTVTDPSTMVTENEVSNLRPFKLTIAVKKLWCMYVHIEDMYIFI